MFLFQPFITIEFTLVCSNSEPCNKAWRQTFDFWFLLFMYNCPCYISIQQKKTGIPYGLDVLRLWVANSGLQTKVAIGNNILDSHQEELFQVCIRVPFPQEINLNNN